MFTITNKLRTIIALGPVGAALASSSVASAAFAVRAPGTGTSVLAGQATVVAQYIDPNKVGSASILDNPRDATAGAPPRRGLTRSAQLLEDVTRLDDHTIAARFRGRYQLRLPQARTLLQAGRLP
jgi:hypothetical protein